jgi:PH/SEC7 domain-containing protein
MGAFTPPVPPLPQDTQRTQPTSPVVDLFTSPRGTSDTTKPLPPIQPTTSQAASEESLVLVEQQSPLQIKPRLSTSPAAGKPPDDFKKSSNHIKRRSMSVGEIDDMKKNMAESSELSSKIPQGGDNRGWDTTLNGILSDFKGELFQLDPISSSLELRDPSTPARRAAQSRSKTDGLVFPYTPNQDDRNATLTLQSTGEERARRSSSLSARRSSTSTEAPIVPPRMSSLIQTPSAPGSTQGTALRSNLKYGPRPLRSRNGYTQGAHAHSLSRDSARLRMQHRSNASSSEPSLIPVGDEVRIREYPGFSLIISHSSDLEFESGSISPMASSQQDLTIGELALGRYPSRNEDSSDMEARGKELASRCFAEDEEFLVKEKIAEWLGGQYVSRSIA